MEALPFKKILTEVLGEYGFIRKGTSYYKDGGEVYCVIGLQKSNFSNSYMINIGYFIKAIESVMMKSKSTEGHLTNRFSSYNFGKLERHFNLDTLSEIDAEKLHSSFRQNISKFLADGLSIQGLKDILTKEPALMNVLHIKAQKYLFGEP